MIFFYKQLLQQLQLTIVNVEFFRPSFPVEKEEVEELPENNAELLLEHVEEEMVWTDSDEDEENMLDVNDLSVLNKVNNNIVILNNIIIFSILQKNVTHLQMFFLINLYIFNLTKITYNILILKGFNFRLKDKNLINQMRIQKFHTPVKKNGTLN